MKALSLHQPWATLVILGIKRIESRSWSTDHRGTIFVHAADKQSRELIELCHEEPFRTALRAAGIHKWQDLPRKAVLGTVELDDCRKIVCAGASLDPHSLAMTPPAEPELSFGRYDPGRFAWMLDRPNKFNIPILHPGRQRLFNIHPQALGLQ